MKLWHKRKYPTFNDYHAREAALIAAMWNWMQLAVVAVAAGCLIIEMVHIFKN